MAIVVSKSCQTTSHFLHYSVETTVFIANSSLCETTLYMTVSKINLTETKWMMTSNKVFMTGTKTIMTATKSFNTANKLFMSGYFHAMTKTN